MNILMTGGTGFIGSALTAKWLNSGHQITILSRQSLSDKPGVNYVSSLSSINEQESFDVAVNLAGYSLFQRPWFPSVKRTIVSSRIETTKSLCRLNRRLKKPFGVLISGSAVGYYGNRNHHWITEQDDNALTFSAQVCKQWEHEALQAEQQGTRVCLIRTGIVLGDGAALKSMKTAARFGLLNIIGSGEQYWPWIDLDDVLQAIDFLVKHPQLTGAFNICSPNPVTNREFTEALAKVLNKKIRLPAMPGFVLKAMTLGSGELLLDSQRVAPSQLLGAGFEFKYEDLQDSLAKYC
ncbi:MAG: TIGR01777 family oxidoreductase [Reinekea sp.]|jgi:uncharacterized protein